MRRVGAVVALLTVVGCSSSGTTATTSTPPVSSRPAAPGGLVGAIDQARLTAVCADARAAQTVESVGGRAMSDPLAAAAGLLERPPVDPQASAAAVSIRGDLSRSRPDLALAATLAFCHAHGG